MKLSQYASNRLPVLQKEDYSAIPNNYFMSLSTITNVFKRFDIIYTDPLFVLPSETPVEALETFTLSSLAKCLPNVLAVLKIFPPSDSFMLNSVWSR